MHPTKGYQKKDFSFLFFWYPFGIQVKSFPWNAPTIDLAICMPGPPRTSNPISVTPSRLPSSWVAYRAYSSARHSWQSTAGCSPSARSSHSMLGHVCAYFCARSTPLDLPFCFMDVSARQQQQQQRSRSRLFSRCCSSNPDLSGLAKTWVDALISLEATKLAVPPHVCTSTFSFRLSTPVAATKSGFRTIL